MASTAVAKPKSVRILGKRHTISYLPTEEMQESFGLCWKGQQRIAIQKDLPHGEQADTVLHEILHAVLFQMAVLHPAELEEEFVRNAATGLYAVLQDNPQFAKWLIQPQQ